MENSYKVTTTPHLDGTIVQTVEHVGLGGMVEQIARKVMHTQELQIRDALVALGWTPPDVRLPLDAQIPTLDEMRKLLVPNV